MKPMPFNSHAVVKALTAARAGRLSIWPALVRLAFVLVVCVVFAWLAMKA